MDLQTKIAAQRKAERAFKLRMARAHPINSYHRDLYRAEADEIRLKMIAWRQ